MPKRFLPSLIILLICLFTGQTIYATHNRAGEITYEQIGDLTIRVTLVTYTKASSVQVDRDTLEVAWGDGTTSLVGRVNNGGNGVEIGNDIKYNVYQSTHTYPGRSTYTISMTDPNRIDRILNVNWPNSVIVPFYIETTFTFLNPQFQGYNNSPILLQPPIDVGCTGQRFIHNPNAYDPDGDSLAYELIIPFQARDSLVPRYEFPDEIEPGFNNQIFFNAQTGDFIWDAPQLAGDYNIAIKIYEFRNGVLINTLIRDMQITINECDSRPPVVDVIDETCVIAGDIVEFDVTVDDPDLSQLVRLSALGGPFIQTINPATFNVLDGYRNAPLTGRFEWMTTCEHISPQFYTVTFKGQDNVYDTTGLVDLKTTRIKVSGPAPEDLSALSDKDKITIQWESPYACDSTLDNYFRGFTIWRKVGSTQVPDDPCNVDLETYGYEIIAFNQRDLADGRYFYEDFTVEKGITYCYRVTAEFALISPGGNPYNRVQSLPSEEICFQLSRDVPLITNVTVNETDLSNGEIRIAWENAVPDDLDTLENPGPYRLQVEVAGGIDGTTFNAIPDAVFTQPTFGALHADTAYTHTGINTVVSGYNYRIAFYVNGDFNTPYGYSAEASSIFLGIVSSDRRNVLNWNFFVPWVNYQYDIFRVDNTSGARTFLDRIDRDVRFYVDRDLLNDEEYCYVVEATGTYGIPDIKDPLINYSQELCGIPIDTVPPCPVQLTLTNFCDDETMLEDDLLINLLTWHFEIDDCEIVDAVGYNVYYSNSDSTDYILLATIDGPNDTLFEHVLDNDLVGCYYVTSIDLKGNESMPSNIVCAQNCPTYRLPNVFTPNGDGKHDIFLPYPYRFVDRVEFKVFSRWGTLVYETNDPDLNWDGKNLNGSELEAGTYHYTCKVFNHSGDGSEFVADILTGFIELVR